MNAKGDANRSVRQTKQRLNRALIDLLQQKPVREITVRELVNRAGVSRGTFYCHYADIYALMEQLETQHLDQLNHLMDALLPNLRQDDVPPALTALFAYLDENDDICRALYGPNGDPNFGDKVKQLIARRCMGHMAPQENTAQQRYLLAFAVNGCLGCVLAWQWEERRVPPTEMARTAWQAIQAVERLF